MRASWSVRNLCWSCAELRLQSTLLVHASFVGTRACRPASRLDGQVAGTPAAGPAGVRLIVQSSKQLVLSLVFAGCLLLFSCILWYSSAERQVCAAGRYAELDFPVVSESVVHQRYLTLFNRRIRFPAVGTRPVCSGAAAGDKLLCSNASLRWGVDHNMYMWRYSGPSPPVSTRSRV